VISVRVWLCGLNVWLNVTVYSEFCADFLDWSSQGVYPVGDLLQTVVPHVKAVLRLSNDLIRTVIQIGWLGEAPRLVNFIRYF